MHGSAFRAICLYLFQLFFNSTGCLAIADFLPFGLHTFYDGGIGFWFHTNWIECFAMNHLPNNAKIP